MKNILFIALLSLITGALSAQIATPSPSPAATVVQSVGLTKITVEYSRPAVKGRKIFGDLAPYDKVWRTGANKITTIKFDHDVLVEGKKLAAGTYGWYTIPGKTEWIIALNSDSEQWGAYGYDQKKDVLRLTLKPQIIKELVENLTIAVEQDARTTASVTLSWEKTMVRFKVEHDAKALILAEIKTKTAMADCKADTYFDAADYYYENNIDLPIALTWADKVVAADQKYWTYQLRARILAKMGQCARAVEDAKISLDMAKKEGDDSYVKKNEAILKQCSGK